MPSFDICHNDAFSLTSLTDYINKMPFLPQKVANLGLFKARPITTTSVIVEEYDGALALVPNKRRGGPAAQNLHNKRSGRNFTVPHLPIEDTILADEIQNVRAFGSESELQTVVSQVQLRQMEMKRKIDATIEFQRLGALKGLILDSDGSTVIYNLFTEFGITQTQVDFNLGTATTDILGATTQVAGAIEDELGEATYDGIQVLAGKVWFERYISHPNVKTAYQFFQERGQTTNPLRQDLRYTGFEYGAITVEQYRGKVGGIQFIADNEAYAFPMGVLPDLFVTHFAPADFIETVNTPGLPYYSKMEEGEFGRSQKLHSQSNPLSLCLRPAVLIKLVTST